MSLFLHIITEAYALDPAVDNKMITDHPANLPTTRTLVRTGSIPVGHVRIISLTIYYTSKKAFLIWTYTNRHVRRCTLEFLPLSWYDEKRRHVSLEKPA
jgi:hypothetical protein